MFPSASARANFFAVCLLSVTAPVPTASAAQTLAPVDTSVRQSFERVLSDPRVKAALAAIERAEPEAIQEQFRLTEIPAPPFKEEKRAAYYLDLLKARGLDARDGAKLDRTVPAVRRGLALPPAQPPLGDPHPVGAMQAELVTHEQRAR